MNNLIRLSTQTGFMVLCREIIAEHATELTIRRNQLTHTSAAGIVDDSRWTHEVNFFIAQIVQPQTGNVLACPERIAAVRSAIDAATVHYLSSRICFRVDNMQHVSYERLVSDSLRDLGWHTQWMRFNNDHQSDVMAEMRDVKVIVHCRRYASSVGMLAIENAWQRQLTAGAGHAAIISDGRFASRAHRLASSRSIVLLHHNVLMQLEERLLGTDTWRKIPPRTASEKRSQYFAMEIS